MRARLTLTLVGALAAGLLVGPASGQSPAPVFGADAVASRQPGAALQFARPRASVLGPAQCAAETFLSLPVSALDRPVERAAGGHIVLVADYEAVFVPATAGRARFDVEAWRIGDAGKEFLARDAADAPGTGPDRQSGVLELGLWLPVGLHHLELVAGSAAWSDNAAQGCTDRDAADLWVLVPDGAAPGPTATPKAAPLPLAPEEPIRLVVERVRSPAGALDRTYAPSALPAAVLGVGSQRGVAAPRIGGAINFPTGHRRTLEVGVGELVRVWSDYELWWAAGAVADGAAGLAVHVAPVPAAVDVAPLAHDESVHPGVSGPVLHDGELVATFAFDRPGSYALAAVLETSVRIGTSRWSDADVVPFTVVVVERPPAVGAIAGRVTDEAGRPLPGIEMSAGFLRLPGDPDVPGQGPDEPVFARTRTNDAGEYLLERLPANAYWVRAADPLGAHLAEYYDDKPELASADKVWVKPGAVTSGIDFALRSAPARAIVHVDPPRSSAVLGATGRFALSVARVEDLAAFETELRWNPAVLRVDEVAIGQFLGSTGRKVIPVTPVIDNVGGRLRFAAASVGEAPGAGGSGQVFTVRFTAVGVGETDVAVVDSILAQTQGRPIEHDKRGGRVIVTECMYGDVNCDCVIDIRDVMAVVVRWGARLGDPNYDPGYDLDRDGDIDVIDIQIVAGLWGRRCAEQIPEPVGGPMDDADRGLPAAASPARPAGTAAEAHSADPRLLLSVTPERPAIGERLTVAVDVVSARDLAGFEVWLDYDAARLRFVTAELGEFLGSTGRSAHLLGPAGADGRRGAGGFSLPGAPAASGDGRLVTYTFEVLAGGESSIRADTATAVDSGGSETAILGAAAVVAPAERGGASAYLPLAALRP